MTSQALERDRKYTAALKTSRTLVKAIGYAYATSAYAKQLGRTKDGCFYVAIKKEEIEADPISLHGPFDDIEAAEAFAVNVVAGWSAYTRRAA